MAWIMGLQGQIRSDQCGTDQVKCEVSLHVGRGEGAFLIYIKWKVRISIFALLKKLLVITIKNNII